MFEVVKSNSPILKSHISVRYFDDLHPEFRLDARVYHIQFRKDVYRDMELSLSPLVSSAEPPLVGARGCSRLPVGRATVLRFLAQGHPCPRS